MMMLATPSASSSEAPFVTHSSFIASYTGSASAGSGPPCVSISPRASTRSGAVSAARIEMQRNSGVSAATWAANISWSIKNPWLKIIAGPSPPGRYTTWEALAIAASIASPPEAVLEHVRDGADLIVPLANGEPRVLIDTLDAHAPSSRRCGCTRCTRCTTTRTFTTRTATTCITSRTSCRRSPAPRSRTATAISCPRTSARCRSCCGATRSSRSCSPPRRPPTGTATCRSARTPTTPPASSGGRRSSSRSTRTCRARSARTRCTSAR